MSQNRYPSAMARVLANTVKPDDQNENGCWEWQGNKNRRHGYGRMSVRVKGKPTPTKVYVHRAVEQHLRQADAQLALDDLQPDWGPLPTAPPVPPLHPDDETIDHLCRGLACANPDHWRVISRADNSREMRARATAKKAKKP